MKNVKGKMGNAEYKRAGWELARSLLAAVALLLIPGGLSAQDAPLQPAEGNEAPAAVEGAAGSPRFLLKNGATSLLDPLAPSFNLALEYRLASRFYGHLEGGPLLPFRYFDEPTTEHLRGARLRAALRYYLRPPRAGAHAAYLELLYAYQYTDARIEGDFLRETPAGSYGQRFSYDFRQRRHAGYLNIGIQQIFAGGFLFETGAGLGPLYRNRRYGGVPADARFHTNGSFIWEYGDKRQESFLSIMLYANLGYAF